MAAVSAAAVPTALVRLRGVSTYFDERTVTVERLLRQQAGVVQAVDGVDLDIRRGEILGLVGESGSGKTTLGRTILSLVPPTSRLDQVRRHGRHALRRRESAPALRGECR